MNCFPTAIAVTCALFWLSAVNAACVSEGQCDDAGDCAQVETCDEVRNMVQVSPNAMTPMSAETDALAVTPVAAAVAAPNANCREVEICGTAQIVCD